MNTDNTTLNWFRHAAPYINDLRGRTLVVAIPGEGFAHDNFRNLVHDLALVMSLGVRLVLVHGARAQVNEALAQSGIASRFQGNTRITDRDTLEVIKSALGKLRFEIEAAFSQGLPDSPMAGSSLKVMSGNLVTARPVGIIDGTDMHWTGRVRRMEAAAIRRALDEQALVLLSPIGTSLTGELFNLNYLDLAAEAAKALAAEKLILFRDVPQLTVNGEPVYELNLNQAEEAAETLDSETLACAITACGSGTQRVHLLSYAENGALLQELFSRGGAGTMIYRDSYEVIRRARIDDVGGILGLIRPLEQQGILVRRSREKLEAEIEHFTLVEVDGTPVACAALYPINDAEGDMVSAEIACVAIHPDFRGGGRGSKLLRHLERQARALGLEDIYVLTTQTEHWFIEKGFAQVAVEDLPSSRQSLYNIQRNSRVLRKPLSAQ